MLVAGATMQGWREADLVEPQRRQDDVPVPVLGVADDADDEALLPEPPEEALRVREHRVRRGGAERGVDPPEYPLERLVVVVVAGLPCASKQLVKNLHEDRW